MSARRDFLRRVGDAAASASVQFATDEYDATTAAIAADEEIRPHPGPQEQFLSNPADICIGGGSAGGGKTFSLLTEPLRHIHVPGFNAVLFRRTYAQLEAAGGPWVESESMYPQFGGRPIGHRWYFTTPFDGRPAEIQFSHLQHEKDRLAWKGAQIALLLFDQLEDFTEGQFWYMTSRIRSISGVRPYVRGTCNPVPPDDPIGGWLRKLLDWWIDPESGFAIPDRAGKIRWFLRVNEQLHWANSREELAASFGYLPPHKFKPRSLSFVPMGLDDNPTLKAKDPDYEAALEALPFVDRMRLRYGNWNVRDSGRGKFERTWFQIVEDRPRDSKIRWLRFWDCAGTEKDERLRSVDDPDQTAGALVGLRDEVVLNGQVVEPARIYIADIRAGYWKPGDVDQQIVSTARADGRWVAVREEEEGGASGKAVVASRAARLLGFDYEGKRSSVAKITRWKPLIGVAQHGHVFLVRGDWNEAFLSQAETADGTDRTHDDLVDAVAGAYLCLAAGEGIKSGGGAIRLTGH